MADRFKAPTMDWASPGDLYNRFKLFKQKCELIFDGPLADTEEAKKTRLLLLWISDKGLEIYNAATWDGEGDNLKLVPVFKKLEAYTKPQSNQILSRFQLRSLKQGNTSLEEFVTKARLLVDDSGYAEAFKDETLRDTLVFGLSSDKVRKDAIDKGNTLTFQQVYNLAKTEESTKAQMKVITQNEGDDEEVHSIRSRNKPETGQFQPRRRQEPRQRNQPNTGSSKQRKFNFKFNGCFRCGNKHGRSANCPAMHSKCNFCGKLGHFAKVCTKKAEQQVHEIVANPEYQGQDIHIYNTDEPRSPYSYDDDQGDTDGPINVVLGTITSTTDSTIHSVESRPSKIYANVKVNGQHSMKLKVDTGADTCVLATDDLQQLPFSLDIVPCSNILKGYGGSKIENLGGTTLNVSFQGKTVLSKFNIVYAPGHPSIIGCKQAQELGIITVNIQEISHAPQVPSTQPHAKANKAAKQGNLSETIVLEEYKDCFDKIGCFPGEEYHIQLNDDARPVIHPPRTVPVHVLPLYKEELEKMLSDDIITKVTEPTDWVNSIVCNITETPDGKKKVRLCLDPKDLNKNIRREHYYSRKTDEILPLLHGSKYFSVADTKKGYWHVKLDHDSSLLCTFNTPFGRYRFKRLPFGVIVSQDIFQRRLDEVYSNIPNVTGIADDIIIYGSTQQEHDQAFVRMLDASRENNVSLNSDKLQFKQPSVNFYGHTLTREGIKPSADKLEAIKNIKTPSNAKELLAILGMITYLNRFSVKLAELTAPLRELTKKNIHFKWEQHHQAALDNIKTELSSTQIISYYDPDPATATILQCDASQVGLGAWVRQIDANNNERIVAMASRTLTTTESRYSNIERECLAVMYGLEKFEYYLLGRHTTVETDHSPLEQIYKKNIAEAPSRLQRLLLRCLKFDIDVKYKPGKTIPVADALSRVCLSERAHNVEGKEDCAAVPEYDIHFVSGVSCPIDTEIVKAAMVNDTTLNMLKNVVFKGWPAYRKQCPQELWEYWNYRCDLVLEDGLILKGTRVVIPESLRKEVMEVVHTGHQGETKCLLMARQSVFWPGITDDIRQMVMDCKSCNKYQPAQPKLPAMQPELPTRPWEKLGTDIFEFNGSKYLMVVDYYSRFPVIRLLRDMTADTICDHFTSVLAEHGLPSLIIADFGSQYTSDKFRRKCEASGITLTFSSPYHHQANSLAERAVGTCKALWKKAVDSKECPYTALWMYRITPIDNNLPSPHELLYGRKPKSLLPSSKSTMQSLHPDNDIHKVMNQHKQSVQTDYYNLKASRDRRPLNTSEPVYVRNTQKQIWEPGVVFSRPNPVREPRTYVVDMGGKLYRRTREHLKPRIEQSMAPPVISGDSSSATAEVTPPASPGHQPTCDKPLNTPAKDSSSKVTPTSPITVSPSTNKTKPAAEAIGVRDGKITYQPRPQTTRSGRVTVVPLKLME